MSSLQHQDQSNREAETVFAAVCDLNGVWRGKRLSTSQRSKLAGSGLRMPLSVSALDIWGADVIDSPLVLASGDADGICMPTGRSPVPMPWMKNTSVFLPLWLQHENGHLSLYDPRVILANIVEAFLAKGMTAVVAMELEFYLYKPDDVAPAPPPISASGAPMTGDHILSLDDLEQFEDFFDDLYTACTLAGVPAESAIAEAGPGQFEVNLKHIADPLKAADDAAIFKKIVRGIANSHQLGATFMAKPYAERAGNGLHVHFSLLDANGRNIFDNGTERGSDLLLNAVAGVLSTMTENTLIWAPHANSYRRLTPGEHAPTAVSWGYENRTSALRIPGGDNASRRIEHRVSGADANPYLVLAAILGGAMAGIENEQQPVKPVTGNAYEQRLPPLASNWENAIARFENATGDVFTRELREIFAQCKHQELGRYRKNIDVFEYQTYLTIA